MNDHARGLSKAVEDWSAAQISGNNGSLNERLPNDFIGVGSLGFTLTKKKWLSRHEGGSVTYRSFELNDMAIRLYEGAEVAVFHQTAAGCYQDESARYDIDGWFRATLMFVGQGGQWRLAGLRLSRIPGSPQV